MISFGFSPLALKCILPRTVLGLLLLLMMMMISGEMVSYYLDGFFVFLICAHTCINVKYFLCLTQSRGVSRTVPDISWLLCSHQSPRPS